MVDRAPADGMHSSSLSSDMREKLDALSPNHAAIFAELQRAARPMTAYEIIDTVRSKGISAPPTVYRALHRLIRLGLAHRLESLNAFVACAHAEAHSRSGLGSVVFMICATCGETQEVIDPVLDSHLRRESGNREFHLEQAMIELRGYCAQCDGTVAAARQEPLP